MGAKCARKTIGVPPEQRVEFEASRGPEPGTGHAERGDATGTDPK